MQLLLNFSTLLFIISSTSASQSFSSDRLLFTSNTRFRPLVAKSFDQLIYVTFPFDPEPRIKLELEKISYEPCEISFAELQKIKRPLKVDNLADGKLLLSLLAEQHVFSLIVDLEKCTYEKASIQVNDDRGSIVILTGEREFDVFLTSYPNSSDDKTWRLRYNETGQLMFTSVMNRPENTARWSISSVGEMDFSKGYFYTIFTADETIVQRLDKDLQMESELLLDSSFLLCDSLGTVNRCRGISSHELECQLFDEELKNRVSSSLDLLEYKNFLRHMRLFNLADGSALVLLVMQVYSEQRLGSEFTTYLQHVDLFGRVSGLLKFQENVCKDIEDIGIIKMKDNLFCISIACRNSLRTKCIVFTV